MGGREVFARIPSSTLQESFCSGGQSSPTKIAWHDSVASLDFGGRTPFYVMPYLEGGSLSQHAGRLGVAQLQEVAENLAGTLATLHIAFDLHGDFKPDNVLLTKQGLLQVADPLGNGTLFTILFAENRGGTPGYMAPEI